MILRPLVSLAQLSIGPPPNWLGPVSFACIMATGVRDSNVSPARSCWRERWPGELIGPGARARTNLNVTSARQQSLSSDCISPCFFTTKQRLRARPLLGEWILAPGRKSGAPPVRYRRPDWRRAGGARARPAAALTWWWPRAEPLKLLNLSEISPQINVINLAKNLSLSLASRAEPLGVWAAGRPGAPARRRPTWPARGPTGPSWGDARGWRGSKLAPPGPRQLSGWRRVTNCKINKWRWRKSTRRQCALLISPSRRDNRLAASGSPSR